MNNHLGFGLNKLARLIAERKKAESEKKAPALNVPWPYQVLAFPFETFGITNYSDAPPDEEV